MDCSLPGSSVRGISQARILERVAISFSRRSSQPREMGRGSRYFPKDIEMVNRHVQRCLEPLIIREMQIKITMGYNIIPVRMAIIIKTRNNNVGAGIEKREPSYTVSGNVNLYSHYGKQYAVSSKN